MQHSFADNMVNRKLYVIVIVIDYERNVREWETKKEIDWKKNGYVSPWRPNVLYLSPDTVN